MGAVRHHGHLRDELPSRLWLSRWPCLMATPHHPVGASNMSSQPWSNGPPTLGPAPKDRGDLDADAVSGPGIGPYPRALQLLPSSSKAGAPRNPHSDRNGISARQLNPVVWNHFHDGTRNVHPPMKHCTHWNFDCRRLSQIIIARWLPSNPDVVGFGKRPARNGLGCGGTGPFRLQRSGSSH